MRPSFSLLMFIVVLFLAWPGSQQLFLRSVENTVRDLHRNAATAIVNFGRFQSDLNNPQTGEQVLPGRVREVLTMLRGQGVKRYRLSDSIAADNWVFQQIIASAVRFAKSVGRIMAELPPEAVPQTRYQYYM